MVDGITEEIPSPAECLATAAALFEAERFHDAEIAYRLLLKRFPLNAGLYNSLATVLDRQGRYREAVAHYTKAVYLQPNLTVARFNLANTLKRLGDNAACIENLQAIVDITPDFAEAWQNLATCYYDTGKLSDAASCLERVIVLEPDRVSCYVELGDIYYKIGVELEKAVECFNLFLTQMPDAAAVLNSKGLVLHEMGDYYGAEASYRLALDLEPRNALIMNNLGVTLLALALPDMAIKYFDLALKITPDNGSVIFNRGMARLLTGDFPRGWQDYERRFDTLEAAYISSLSLPHWSGEALEGRTLIVRSEQAYGDNIQFARYLPLLAIYGGKVVFECMDTRIKPLFLGLPGIDSLMVRGEPFPPADFQVPLASLPRLFNTDLASVPSPAGYLHTCDKYREMWATLIDSEDDGANLKVGIVWGGRKPRLNSNRSLSLSDLEPLFSVQGIKWYSLQMGEDTVQLDKYRNVLIDMGAHIISFADTAAIIDNLNLIITIDTAMAHLAGALGVPAWVLLKYSPDWRWLLERNNSPWYDSLRLFRQKTPGDWSTVVSAVAVELKKRVPKAR